MCKTMAQRIRGRVQQGRANKGCLMDNSLCWYGCPYLIWKQNEQCYIVGLVWASPYSPASCEAMRTNGGTEVKATMIVPNRLIDRLEKAAARGSDASSIAVPIADELPPRVTPRVM